MLDRRTSDTTLPRWICLAVVLGMAAAASRLAPPTSAQDEGGATAGAVDTMTPLEDQGRATVDTDDSLMDESSDDEIADVTPQLEGINIFRLLVQGGYFMVPILIMSLVVVTFSFERFVGLRRSKVLPQGLVTALGQIGDPQGGFDPRQAYRVCQQFPSAASTVVRAMLLKIGRPHSEVEHAVAEASEREAARLYANVRWLNLAATVTPLLGLMGTVWGMIRAFHDTTQLAPGQNKADYLAEGIYIALVTTLSGLSVAIPAAIFSHFFEGRIQTLFHQADEMLFNLLPQIERFEGRVRFSRQLDASEGDVRQSTLAPPPVQEKTSAGN
jgi:biopolymer transport protein ExbB